MMGRLEVVPPTTPAPPTAPPQIANMSAVPVYVIWASSLTSQDISRMIGAVVVSVIIIAFSAPPAAVIWRTPSLHRVSYYYVMILCLLDCLIGLLSGTMVSAAVVVSVLLGGVPAWYCTVFEAGINCCMNSVSVVMLALGRDRYLSIRYALRYPIVATTESVRRHLKMAALYGSVHGALVLAARAYFSDLRTMQPYCDALHWLVAPQYRVVAVVTVFSNIFLDIGTMSYNVYVMHCAWKVSGYWAAALLQNLLDAGLAD